MEKSVSPPIILSILIVCELQLFSEVFSCGASHLPSNIMKADGTGRHK